MNILFEQRFEKSCSEKVTDLDFEALADSNTYILIVPSAKKCRTGSNKDVLTSDRLITLSSEEFLLAFQSLLGEYKIDKFPESSAKKVDSSSVAAVKKNAVESVRKCNMATQTKTLIGKQGNTHSDKITVTVGTQTTEIKQILTASDESGAERLYDISKVGKKNVDGKFTANNDAGSTVREEDLKTSLYATNYNIRNVILDNYVENWNSSKDITRLTPLKYIQSHLNLLVDYMDDNKISAQCNAKLLRRYFCYLKRLIVQFIRKPNDPSRVIKFDQAVLTQVRQIGAWNFPRAWFRVEEEKKENSYQQSVSNDTHAERNLNETKKVGTGRSSPFLKQRLSSKMQRISLSPDQKFVSSPQDKIDQDLSSRLFSRLNNENADTDHRLEMLKDIRSTRQVKRIPRKKSLSPRPSSAKRSRLADRIGVVQSNCIASGQNKRFRKTPEMELQPRSYCKYFNTGYCFKSASECTFLHACNVCLKPSHGRFQCPNA